MQNEIDELFAKVEARLALTTQGWKDFAALKEHVRVMEEAWQADKELARVRNERIEALEEEVAMLRNCVALKEEERIRLRAVIEGRDFKHEEQVAALTAQLEAVTKERDTSAHRVDLLLEANGKLGKQLTEFGDEINSRGARVAQLEGALRWIAESGTVHVGNPVLPVCVEELQQFARAALSAPAERPKPILDGVFDHQTGCKAPDYGECTCAMAASSAEPPKEPAPRSFDETVMKAARSIYAAYGTDLAGFFRDAGVPMPGCPRAEVRHDIEDIVARIDADTDADLAEATLSAGERAEAIEVIGDLVDAARSPMGAAFWACAVRAAKLATRLSTPAVVAENATGELVQPYVALLESTLRDCRKGYMNILEFRKLGYQERYGALTRVELEQSIAKVDGSLSSKETAE